MRTNTTDNTGAGSLICFWFSLVFMLMHAAYSSAQQYPIQVNVQVVQPVSPYLPQLLGDMYEGNTSSLAGDISDKLRITLMNSGNSGRNVKLSGKIERLSPAPMKISLNPAYAPPRPIVMEAGQMVPPGKDLINQAFGYFTQNDLVFDNTSLSELKGSGTNYKLPEGTYRLCISAFDYDKMGMNGPLSAPGTGCATFTICYTASAPQLIMPVSTIGQTDSGFQEFFPNSPQIQFAWTVPSSTCGLPMNFVTYDLEIKKVLPGQSITDAASTNNPSVFTEVNIPRNNFILDTMRYPFVFEKGERYVVRVKANVQSAPGDPLSIANNGYSQIGGLTYMVNESGRPETTLAATEETLDEDAPEYATNEIKGRLSWSFRKSEDDYVAAHQPAHPVTTNLQGTHNSTNLEVTPLMYYMGNSAIATRNIGALQQADQTLSSVGAVLNAVSNTPSAKIQITGEERERYESETLISSNAALAINYQEDDAAQTKSAKKFPLERATIQLKLVRAKITQSFSGLEQELNNALGADIDVMNAGRTPQNWDAIIGGGILGLDVPNQPTLPGSNQPGLPGNNPPGGLPDGPSGDLPDFPARGPNMSGYDIPLWEVNNNVEETIEKKWTTIATTTSEEDGSFNFGYIDPEYLEDASQGEGLLLTIDKPGFYHFAYYIDADRVNSTISLDLGELVLLANTYRFTALVKDVMNPLKGKPTEGLKVSVYRNAESIERNPFLEQEKNPKANASPNTKMKDGKRYVLVAVGDDGQLNGDQLQFDFGKLFMMDELLVEMTSTERNLQSLTTKLQVSASTYEDSKVVHAYANYQLPFAPPSIEGSVLLRSSDNEVSHSVKNALIRVSFNPEDAIDYRTEIPPEDRINPATFFAANNVIDKSPMFQSSLSHQLIMTNNEVGAGMMQPMMLTTDANINNVDFQSLAVSGTLSAVPLDSRAVQIAKEMIDFGDRTGGAYAVTTDEDGYFYVGNLPVLKDGAKYTVSLVSVPEAYKNLEITPGNREEEVAVAQGTTPFVSFGISGEIFPFFGQVVDEDGQAVRHAKLHFKDNDGFFETNEQGAFQTKYFEGEHTLIIEKSGYVAKEGKVTIDKNETVVYPPLVKEKGTTPLYTYTSKANLSNENISSFYNLVARTPSGQKLIQRNDPPTETMGVTPSVNASYTVNYPSVMPAAVSSAYRYLENPFTDGLLSAPGIMDVGQIGFLEKKKTKVKFVVRDKDNHTQTIANVRIGLLDTTHVTDRSGEWKYEGLGGETTVTFVPEKGSGYVPVQLTIDLPISNDFVTKEIFLEKGVRVYGNVTVQGDHTPIDSAKITPDGQAFAHVLTDGDGFYEFFVSKDTTHDIRATKVAYVSATVSEDIESEDVNINFELKDGGGKNISDLLGFEIVLDSIKENTDGTQTWTGEFVNLKPFLPVLEVSQEAVLPFYEINVSFPDGVNASPEGDSVIVDKGFIPLKLFTYIPLKLENGKSSQMVVKKSVKGEWGSISGTLRFDPGGIFGEGREILQFFSPALVPDIVSQTNTPGSIEFFLGEGASGLPSFGAENEGLVKDWITEQAAQLAGDLAPGATTDIREEMENAKAQLQNLKFRFQSLLSEYDTVSVELYGFRAEFDLVNSSVSQSGISLAGAIHTPQIGPVDPFDIPFNELSFTPSFAIGTLDVDPQYLPEIRFGEDVLSAKLTKLNISENGITTSGIAKIKLPYSKTSFLKMDDLQLSTSGISGGKFKFGLDGLGQELIDSLKQEAVALGEEIREDAQNKLKNGIDLFNTAIIKDNGSSLSFGRLSGTNAYFLSGSVDMEFVKWIKKDVVINNFMLATDGTFSLNVPANYSADFGFASYAMDAIGVAYSNGTPSLKLEGKFDVNIPTLTLSASNINFIAQRGAPPQITTDSIEAKLDIPGINSRALVGLLENGFSGGGGLNLIGTDYGADIDFHYLKDINLNSLDFGASFKANATIPIGVITIGSLGGGFTYGTDPATGQYKFSVSILGSASVLNLDKAVQLKNINLTVEAGGGRYPVVKGATDVEVASSLNLATAKLLLDFNQDLFAIDVNVKAEPLEGVASMQMDGTMQVSWNKQNPYVFFGAASSISVVGGFIKGNGEFALGINVKPTVRSDPSRGIGRYFQYADAQLLPSNANFSGLYVRAGAEVGSKTKDLFGGDIGIASAHVRFYSSSDATLFMNFADNRYHASLGGELYFYADASVLGMSIVDAKAGACYRISGGRSDNLGWYFQGKASAYFSIGILAAPSRCNSINYYQGGWSLGIPVPIGGRACGTGYASIDYSQTNGIHFSGGIGVPSGDTSFNCN